MASLEERVSNLENLLHTVITSINATRQSISNGFTKIDDNFSNINQKISKIDTEINSLHNKIDKLSGDTATNFDDVKLELESIQEEMLAWEADKLMGDSPSVAFLLTSSSPTQDDIEWGMKVKAERVN